MDDEFYDGLEQAAQDLGCAQTTLSSWIRSGRLHAQRRFGPGRGGGSWRVAKKDLIAAAKTSTRFAANANWLELNGGAAPPAETSGTKDAKQIIADDFALGDELLAIAKKLHEVDGILVTELLGKVRHPGDQQMILRDVNRRWG